MYWGSCDKEGRFQERSGMLGVSLGMDSPRVTWRRDYLDAENGHGLWLCSFISWPVTRKALKTKTHDSSLQVKRN